MYNYQDIERISGVKSKITKRILKQQKMSNKSYFNDRDVKIIINEVEKYERRQMCLQLFLFTMVVLFLINLYM